MSRLEERREILVREIGESEVPTTRQESPKAVNKNFKLRRELGEVISFHCYASG